VTFLLDTNACIRYLNGRSDALRKRLDATGDANVVLCSVVRAELAYGAAKSLAPQKTLRIQQQFAARFRSLPFDDAAAQVYGPIRADLERAGNVIGSHDLLIAAIAVANNLTLVTHNVGEFRRIANLVVEDWERV
jgi:tRNA(fMet)-specific endonuclease VapC